MGDQKSMSRVFAAFPSYKGISDVEARERFAEGALRAAGHDTALAVLRGHALLDYARAELTAVFKSSGFDMVLYQDDDVAIEPSSICRMVKLAADRGIVVVAPYRLRTIGNMFSVFPIGEPDADGLVKCMWTGLGCVLVPKQVIEKLYVAYAGLLFRSELTSTEACGLFNALVVDAGEYEAQKKGQGVFLGDDRAFSHRLLEQCIPIYADVYAVTDHRGLRGCLAEAGAVETLK
jgi:hypothetical protein